MIVSFIPKDHLAYKPELISSSRNYRQGVWLPPQVEEVRIVNYRGDPVSIQGTLDQIVERLRDYDYWGRPLDTYEGCLLTLRGRRVYDMLDSRNGGGNGPRVMQIGNGPLFEIAINPLEVLTNTPDWDHVGEDLLTIDWMDGCEVSDHTDFAHHFRHAFPASSFNTATWDEGGRLSMVDRIFETSVSIRLFRIAETGPLNDQQYLAFSRAP